MVVTADPLQHPPHLILTADPADGIIHAAVTRAGVHHLRARVRAPYLNGKIERLFKTFRLWWRLLLCGLSRRALHRRLDDFLHWYNHHRPHSALAGLTPDEAWHGAVLPPTLPLRQRDPLKPRIHIRRLRCRGDPRLPILQITLRPAA